MLSRLSSCRGYTVAYAAAGSAMKSLRQERRMVVQVGTVVVALRRLLGTSYATVDLYSHGVGLRAGRWKHAVLLVSRTAVSPQTNILIY